MNIKPIRSDDDLRAAFKQLELVFQAREGTPEADEMEVLVTLIEAYEQALPNGPCGPCGGHQIQDEATGTYPQRP